MTMEHDLPVHDLLRLASGSWGPLEDLLERVARQPEAWISEATRAVGLPADHTLLDLSIEDLEAARERLRANRHALDPQVTLLANIIIITAGVCQDRMLTSASTAEVEYAITAMATAMPESWNSILDRALTSCLLDPPRGFGDQRRAR